MTRLVLMLCTAALISAPHELLAIPPCEQGPEIRKIERSDGIHSTDAKTVTEAPRLRVDETRSIYVCEDYGLYYFVPVDDDATDQNYRWSITDAEGRLVQTQVGAEPLLFGTASSPYVPGEVYHVEIRVLNADGSLSEPANFEVPFEFNHPYTNPWGRLFLFLVFFVGVVGVLIALVTHGLVAVVVLSRRRRRAS